MKDNDEWTTVSRKQNRNKRGRKPARSHHQLEVEIVDSSLKTVPGDRSKPAQLCPRLVCLVEDCMDTLQTDGDYHKIDFDLDALLTSIQKSAGNSKECTQQKTKESFSSLDLQRKVGEIVCYGIGNFDPDASNISMVSHIITSSRSYSAPLIQLACALLLRQYLAMERSEDELEENITDKQKEESKSEGSKMEDSSPFLSYAQQQDLIPILYFEPLLSPSERVVLEDYFCVKVLEANEQGKRPIGANSNDSDVKNVAKDKQTTDLSMMQPYSTTLFYMPHCPMRLYSNVLWANWSLKSLRHLIILGNSFKAYDGQISSIEQIRDETNAIFPILPFVQEEAVLTYTKSKPKSCTKRKHKSTQLEIVGVLPQRKLVKNKYNCEMTEYTLEKAFNDCVITYFSIEEQMGNGINGNVVESDSLDLPKRPLEHFVTEGDEMF